jgi:hypothetical protein
MQTTRRYMKRCEPATRHKAHLLLSALAGPLQQLASLIIATESHERLCGTYGRATRQVEITAPSGTPETLERNFSVTRVERVGARIDQASGIIVADRPTCPQEFVDFHQLSVCDRLTLRRSALIRRE